MNRREWAASIGASSAVVAAHWVWTWLAADPLWSVLTTTEPRTGRYLNADLSEYLVPVNADVPDINVILIDEDDPHVDEIGVKGIGEIGTTGVAAAVANAVFHATGIRVRDLPITLDKLLAVRP